MVSLWLYSWSQLTCSPSVHILHEHLIPQLSFTPAEARLPSCSISAFNPLHSWERLLWPGTEHSRFHQNLNFKRWLVFLGLPRKPSNLDEDRRQMSLSKRTLFCTGTEYKAQSANSEQTMWVMWGELQERQAILSHALQNRMDGERDDVWNRLSDPHCLFRSLEWKNTASS